jgi:hypothetical protein
MSLLVTISHEGSIKLARYGTGTTTTGTGATGIFLEMGPKQFVELSQKQNLLLKVHRYLKNVIAKK